MGASGRLVCSHLSSSPTPLQWLKDPGPRTEKRTLCCDMVCFLFITPLAAISGWLCLRGAQDHLRLHSRLEAVGLIALTIALFTIYVLWTLVSGISWRAGIWGSPTGSSQARGLVIGFEGDSLPASVCGLWWKQFPESHGTPDSKPY